MHFLVYSVSSDPLEGCLSSIFRSSDYSFLLLVYLYVIIAGFMTDNSQLPTTPRRPFNQPRYSQIFRMGIKAACSLCFLNSSFPAHAFSFPISSLHSLILNFCRAKFKGLKHLAYIIFFPIHLAQNFASKVDPVLPLSLSDIIFGVSLSLAISSPSQ